MNEIGIAEADINAVVEGIKRLGSDVQGFGTVDPAWARPPAVLVIDCVLSLNRKYDGFVVPRLDAFVNENPKVRKVRDLAKLIASYPTPHAFVQQELNYNYKDRANTLHSVVEFVCKIVEEMPNVPEEDVLKQWAIQAKPEDYQKLNIRGFGIAGFQYLRMLFGADTTKPDVHIIRFVSKILDRNVSAIEALHLLEKSSECLGLSVRDVDTYIWEISARPQQDVIDTNYQVARPAIGILNGREYQHVNSSKWPNQDALYEALNIYRDAMRPFIFRNLKKVQGLRKEDRIEKSEDIDIGKFPHLIRNYWRDIFEQCFDSDRDVRSVVGIITEARNKVAHPGAEDPPLEYAIGRLHDIADLLGRINAPEQKREVEAICEKLLTNAVTPNAAKQISEISEKLETSETQKKKYKENFEKADKQLKNLENEHNANKEQSKTIQTQLTEVESQKRNADEQLTTKMRDLKAAEDLLSEKHVARPARDIQTEKKTDVGYSEFWAPIRNGEFGELFAGKPVPIGSEGFISKTIRGVEVCLNLNNHNCYIRLWLYGKNRSERRDEIKKLFQESIYDCEDKDTPKGATLIFPVLDKGKNDRDDWDEIREELVTMGTDIYNKIRESVDNVF